jgi:predicted neutral ceramidase superfamily lipid hydrolase
MSPSSLERLSQEIDHCTSLGEIAEVFERNEHEFEAQLEEIEVRLKYDKARLKLLQGLNTVVIVVTVTTIVATMGNLLFRK